MFKICKTRQFLKDEKALAGMLAPKTLERMFERLGQDPFHGPCIKKLRGSENRYRYRLGRYRAFYIVDGETVAVVMMTLVLRDSQTY